MSATQTQPLPAKWKERLDLTMRDVPELYEDPNAVGQSAHANAIRITLADLGASAVFCVQEIPTVVIVVLEEYDRKRVIDLHGVLWNQGLATLLLVLSGDTLRAFSLARIPSRDGSNFDDRCLVKALDATKDVLAAKDIIYGAESGRLWERYPDFFKASERIDHVLLDNLTVSYGALREDDLSTDAAQALLIQTMFIAYLEHRGIVQEEYLKDASGGISNTFHGILKSASSTALYRLFERLREDFNGDLFVAPCSFDPQVSRPHIGQAHMETLERFLNGHEEMGDGVGQLRFWGYDFKYIPIELISAVYDRFLGEQEEEQKKHGAYYTPMFLADTVIATLWDTIPTHTRASGQFLDPACGSGVFLVRAFQLLCEHWRTTHYSRTLPWEDLCTILSRLHGWDLSAAAVRVTVFSLYLALLQEVTPPDIRLLIGRGRLLPKLWDRTLRAQDFFGESPDALQVDIVLGNPPWSSWGGEGRPSALWSQEHQLPMPGGEDAWAFVWKALRHVRKNGMVGFLLPAMGFLHNQAPMVIKARNRLICNARIFRIVNFSDMRFQLFEYAVHPAALVIFGRGQEDFHHYRFDYWTPKADLNLKTRRAITLSSVDKRTITSRDVMEHPLVFKRRLWMSAPESKLFGYLESLPKLGDLVSTYRSLYHRRESMENRWVIGRGFQAARVLRLDEDDYQHQNSDMVAKTPFLPIKGFRALAQGLEGLQPFENSRVHRKGFEQGFNGPRVLVPCGITKDRRLRASYLEEPLTFRDNMLAIAVPAQNIERAKLLTALLNSRLLFWYAFHGTSSFGSERPQIKQAELLRLPFPEPNDVQNSSRSEGAGVALVSLVDEARRTANEYFMIRSTDEGLFDRLDSLCYTYFGLGEEEISLIEDTVKEVIPCVQPRRATSVDLWKPAGQSDRRVYASTLGRSMKQWFDEDVDISVVLEALNEDLALLRLRLVEGRCKDTYRERDNQAIGKVLRQLSAQVEVSLPGNFQLIPDFRVFIGHSLYLIKPLQRRFWLKSAAIADADAVAMDLHDATALGDSA